MMNNISVFGGNGKTTDNRTHVPLIVGWPRKVKPNAYIKILIDFIDIFPTICDSAGIQLDSNLDLDGVSFYSGAYWKKSNIKKMDPYLV